MLFKFLAQNPFYLFAELSWVSCPPAWGVGYVFDDPPGGLKEVNPETYLSVCTVGLSTVLVCGQWKLTHSSDSKVLNKCIWWPRPHEKLWEQLKPPH